MVRANGQSTPNEEIQQQGDQVNAHSTEREQTFPTGAFGAIFAAINCIQDNSPHGPPLAIDPINLPRGSCDSSSSSASLQKSTLHAAQQDGLALVPPAYSELGPAHEDEQAVKTAQDSDNIRHSAAILTGETLAPAIDPLPAQRDVADTLSKFLQTSDIPVRAQEITRGARTAISHSFVGTRDVVTVALQTLPASESLLGDSAVNQVFDSARDAASRLDNESKGDSLNLGGSEEVESATWTNIRRCSSISSSLVVPAISGTCKARSESNLSSRECEVDQKLSIKRMPSDSATSSLPSLCEEKFLLASPEQEVTTGQATNAIVLGSDGDSVSGAPSLSNERYEHSIPRDYMANAIDGQQSHDDDVVAEVDQGSLASHSSRMVLERDVIASSITKSTDVEATQPSLTSRTYHFNFPSEGRGNVTTNTEFREWLKSEGWLDEYCNALAVPRNTARTRTTELLESILVKWDGGIYNVALGRVESVPVSQSSPIYPKLMQSLRNVLSTLKRKRSRHEKQCSKPAGHELLKAEEGCGSPTVLKATGLPCFKRRKVIATADLTNEVTVDIKRRKTDYIAGSSRRQTRTAATAISGIQASSILERKNASSPLLRPAVLDNQREHAAGPPDRMLYYNTPRGSGQVRSAFKNATFTNWLKSEGWFDKYLDASSDLARSVVDSAIAAWDGGYYDMTCQRKTYLPLDPLSPLYMRISTGILRILGNMKHKAAKSKLDSPSGTSRARRDQIGSVLHAQEPVKVQAIVASAKVAVTRRSTALKRTPAKRSKTAKSFMPMGSSSTAPSSRRHTRSAALAIGGIWTISDTRSAMQIMIGPHFQCELPPCQENLCGQSESADNHATCIWDPVQAEQAKGRGQDIDSFLSMDEPLAMHARKMEALHKSQYNVETARELVLTLSDDAWKHPVEFDDYVDDDADL